MPKADNSNTRITSMALINAVSFNKFEQIKYPV